MLAHTSLQGQHSIVDPRCQSGKTPSRPGAAPEQEGRRIAARYGAGALQGGFTAVPNLLLRHYPRLGLSTAELVCVQQLLSYWWGEHLPHPAVASIAERMGKCVRQVQYYLGCLQRKGLLRVVERQGGAGGRLTNAYDLSPLLAALATCAEGDDAREGGARAEQAPSAQQVAPPDPQAVAPEEDATRQDADLDLDSIPQTPAAPRRREGGPRAVCAANSMRGQPADPDDDLRGAVLALGRSLGDTAPGASVSRVRRLLRQAPRGGIGALSLLEEARTRTEARIDAITLRHPSGAPNAMPYLLATLGTLVQQGGQLRPGPAGGRAAPAPPARAPLTPVADGGAASPDLPPSWRAALDVLRRTLPAAVVEQRLLPLRAEQADPALVRLQAPTAFERLWLERVARVRIERAFAECGYGDVRVDIAEQPEGAASGSCADALGGQQQWACPTPCP